MLRVSFIFIDQEMIDDFHHGREVTLFLKFSRIHIYQAKQLISVYQIKVAGKGKVACRNSMTLYKGMAKFNIVSSLGSISQMAQQHFTHKSHMPFHKTRMFFDIRVKFFKLIDFFPNLSENIRNGLWRCAPDTVQKRIP